MTTAPPRPGRSKLAWALLALFGMLAFAGFIGLGNWQVQRLAWKEALIERVNSRVHAPAQPLPAPAEWPSVTADQHEYLHVQVTGTFLPERVTLVTATTTLGQGYWVLTPLRRDDGRLVMINRGFMPPDQRDAARAGAFTPAGEVTVTGLLRLNEPGGGVLRDNVPAEGRWYSRDVLAMARHQGLDRVAPFFVDAGATGAERPGPVGGLTVIAFRNNHLSYAITWYALALLVLIAAGVVIRYRRLH